MSSTRPTHWRLWWRLARPFSLTASIIPVLVGTAVAAADGSLHAWDVALAMLVASMLIQVATNMFNEYYDYRRGLDTPESVGIAGVLVHGSLRPLEVFGAAILCFALALALGIYIVLRTDPMVFWIGVASALAGYVYTGGPFPLAYTPIGELEVLVFMGPVIVGLAYFIQAGHLSPVALWASAPVGCLVAAILLANNLRDMQEDHQAGRKTLPLVVGKTTALAIYAFLMLGAFLATAAGVALLALPPTALLVLVVAPSVGPLVRLYRATAESAMLDRGVRGSAALHARFGLLLAGGLGLGPLAGWTPP